MTKKLSLLFLICVLSALNINAEVYSGSCGNNVRYSLDTSTGLLSITGTGAMTNYSSYSYVPWYKYRSYIKSVEISDGVTSIGQWAFDGCSGLTSVTIPNSVTSIGIGAFNECSDLTSITIPNSVKSIGSSAFYGCSGLTSVTIPNSVKSIESWAFAGCSGLTSVTIPNSVTSIEYYAFSGCSKLTSIEIPNSVTSIGYQAFSGCSGLTSIEIPNSVTSIGYSAFAGCEGLTSVTIPNSVKSIGSDAFSGTAWYNNQPDGLVYAGLVAYKYKGTMPANTSITIKEGTLGIGSGAFYWCPGLTSVTIPNSVTSIEKNAFNGCYLKKQDFINNSSLDAEANNYWGAAIVDSKENGFMIKDGTLISYIGNEASVTIPNSVTSIGESAFEGCEDLTSITIPNSVMNIGSLAFGLCPSLTKVIVSDIAAWCRISFADQFSNPLNCAQHLYSDENTEIKDLVIPNSVTSTGNYAFTGCSGLTSVTIPNSVTSIGEDAFSCCSGLTSVTIPNSVTSIGKYAFSECSKLTSITIPNSVTTIGEEAFSMCPSLTSVTCEATEVPSTGNRVFSDVTQSNATLYVPYSAMEVYKTTEPWSKFGTIVALPALRGDLNGDGVVSMPDAMFIVNKILNGKFPDE